MNRELVWNSAKAAFDTVFSANGSHWQAYDWFGIGAAFCWLVGMIATIALFRMPVELRDYDSLTDAPAPDITVREKTFHWGR